MATVSFKKKKEGEAAATVEAAPQTETQPQAAPVQDAQLATRPESRVGSPIPQHDDMGGAWDRSDVRLPRVNLIHKTSKGPLIEAFGIGGFALDQIVKLSDGKTPITVTALRSGKDYCQKLPFGAPEKPTVFDTPEQVIAAGGSLNYKDAKSGNFFGPRAHIELVFEVPAGLTDEEGLSLFPFEFEGKHYGSGLITVSSSAYTSVAKELATLRDRNFAMKKGLLYGRLALTSEDRNDAQRDWKVPVIKFIEATPEAMVEFFKSLL